MSIVVRQPFSWGEDDDRGVDVARLADRRIDPDPAEGVDGLDFAARHVTSHVEVVDRHVVEDAARHLDVGDRWRGWITAGDVDDLHIADCAVGNGVGDGLVRGIEAPVEADVQRHAGGFDGGETSIDLGDVEADRLLAEDRPARLGGGDHHVDMGVGRGADRDCVGVDRHRVLKAGGDGYAELGTDRFCGLGEDVEHADDLGAGDPAVEVLGVHRPDAAAAEHDETNGHGVVSW